MTFRKARISGETPGNSSGKLAPSNSKILPIPTMPNQVPLLLIPGILGNPAEYQELVETLRDMGDNRDIYIWCNPQITGNANFEDYDQSSLQKQALLIAESIRKLGLDPSVVLLMVGFSYGCGLAAAVANILSGIDIELFLIDGPSPDCAKEYFSRPSLSLTTDLSNVVKYATTLSAKNVNFKEENISFPSEYLESLVLLSPAECIDALAKVIIENCSSVIDEDQFAKNIKIAKQDIYNLINAPDQLFDSKFHKIISLITNQTAAKYNDKFGGWKRHAETLSVIDDPLLVDQDHRALLKQDREYRNLLVLKDEPTNNDVFDDQTIAILKKAKEISVYRTINNTLEVHVLPKKDVDSKILELLEQNSSEKDIDTVIIEFLDKNDLDSEDCEDETLQDLLFYFTLKCGYSNVSKLAQSLEKFINQEVKVRKPIMFETHLKALEEHVNLLLKSFCDVDKYPKSTNIMQLYATAANLHNCSNPICTESLSSEVTAHTPLTQQNINDTKVYISTQTKLPHKSTKRPLLTKSGSSTKIESFSNSDNDNSADEESDKELSNADRVNPEKYFEEAANQLKLITQRLRLFTPHACGKENTPPESQYSSESDIQCSSGLTIR